MHAERTPQEIDVHEKQRNFLRTFFVDAYLFGLQREISQEDTCLCIKRENLMFHK